MGRPALVLILLLSGCAGVTRVESPASTVRSYASALAEGDARTAWALLDEEAREGRLPALARAEERGHGVDAEDLLDAPKGARPRDHAARI